MTATTTAPSIPDITSAMKKGIRLSIENRHSREYLLRQQRAARHIRTGSPHLQETQQGPRNPSVHPIGPQECVLISGGDGPDRLVASRSCWRKVGKIMCESTKSRLVSSQTERLITKWPKLEVEAESSESNGWQRKFRASQDVRAACMDSAIQRP